MENRNILEKGTAEEMLISDLKASGWKQISEEGEFQSPDGGFWNLLNMIVYPKDLQNGHTGDLKENLLKNGWRTSPITVGYDGEGLHLCAGIHSAIGNCREVSPVQGLTLPQSENGTIWYLDGRVFVPVPKK